MSKAFTRAVPPPPGRVAEALPERGFVLVGGGTSNPGSLFSFWFSGVWKFIRVSPEAVSLRGFLFGREIRVSDNSVRIS